MTLLGTADRQVWSPKGACPHNDAISYANSGTGTEAEWSCHCSVPAVRDDGTCFGGACQSYKGNYLCSTQAGWAALAFCREQPCPYMRAPASLWTALSLRSHGEFAIGHADSSNIAIVITAVERNSKLLQAFCASKCGIESLESDGEESERMTRKNQSCKGICQPNQTQVLDLMLEQNQQAQGD